MAFLLTGLVLGGAGSGYPIIQSLIELAAIALILRAVLVLRWSALAPSARCGLAVIIGFMLLAASQLVPLPADVWAGIAGREVAVAIAQAATLDALSRPLSLAPDATRLTVLAWLVPLAAFLLVAPLAQHRRLVVLRVVVGIATAGAILGIFQIATGDGGWLVPFETAHRDFGVGLFVNRNHQAMFLLIALILAAMPDVIMTPASRPMRQSRRNKRREDGAWGGIALTGRGAALIGVIAMLALGVLATTSRTGLFFLPFALLCAFALSGQGLVVTRRWRIGLGLGFSLVCAGVYASPLFQHILQRFSGVADEQRFQYWDNTLYALRDLLPWGSGFGSFTAIYPTVEPLDQVSPLIVNHAHNDYLELALEGGYPALALGFAGLVLVVLRLIGMARAAQTRPQAVALGGAIVVFLGFSVVDYPARMAALALLAGLLFAMLFPAPERSLDRARTRGDGTVRSGPLRLVLGGGLAAVVLWQSASAGFSALLVRADQPQLAVQLAPWSGRAWQALAYQHLLAGRFADAAPAAEQALRLAPLDAAALRTLGLARNGLGQNDQAGQLLSLGARLGWRDGLTQLWLGERGLETGNYAFAVQRIDGLLRQHRLAPQLLPRLAGLIGVAQARQAIATQLADRPGWRQGFFNALGKQAPAALPHIKLLLADLQARGAAADTAETALIRASLAEAGRYADVAAIWAASGGNAVPGDGGFDLSAAVMPAWAAPYVWQASDLPGVSVSTGVPDVPSHGKAAIISSQGVSQGAALVQHIALAAGEYRLQLRLNAPESAPLRWTISCLGAADGQAATPVALQWSDAGRGWRRGTGSFRVGTDCAGQALSLVLGDSSAQPISFMVDDVSIDSVRKSSAGQTQPSLIVR